MTRKQTKFAKNNFHMIFNHIVVAVVMIIPFLYSFFYLKAYWNPYGEGNIDNLPVVIVNSDKGSKGKDVVNSIVDSGKLKIYVEDEKDAEDGLNNGDYYALISIPEDFTKSLESASSKDKKHATITYSPNQKSNYLASQIINSVVNAVEKNLDNQVNSAIVSNLSDNLNEVPSSLDEINKGFVELSNGTCKLVDGTKKVSDGANELNDGINSLKTNVNKLYKGSKTITDTVDSSISSLTKGKAIDDKTLNALKSESVKGVDDIFTETYKNQLGDKAGKEAVASLASNEEYSAGKAALTNGENQLAPIVNGYNTAAHQNLDTYNFCKDFNQGATGPYGTYNAISAAYSQYVSTVTSGCAQYTAGYEKIKTIENVAYQVAYKTAIKAANESAKQTASTVSVKVAKAVALEAQNKTINSLKPLSSGLNTLTAGLYQLNSGADINKLYNGVEALADGSKHVYDGTSLLNSSVLSAKNKISSKTDETEEDLEVLDGLKDYSEEPVKINTEEVNEIDSYGIAFAPLFISIGLWVGCLMFFVTLYYDKRGRFERFDKNSTKLVRRTMLFHAITTASSLILGLLLHLLLDFEVSNLFLYYLSIVLIGNLFMAIMNFLIVNFDDVGKLLGLIILVLQLAASGGTFPIETVTQGFRWLNSLLPMTYTINLLKETIVSLQNNLFIHNFIIVLIWFIIFFVINLTLDIIRQRKLNK